MCSWFRGSEVGSVGSSRCRQLDVDLRVLTEHEQMLCGSKDTSVSNGDHTLEDLKKKKKKKKSEA